MKAPSRRRDILTVAALLIVLAVLSVAAALQEGSSGRPIPLDSDSTAPNGARALAIWLEAIGHPVSSETGTHFTVPPGTGVLFILEPGILYSFSETEMETIEAWVRDGGLLIFASGFPFLSSPAQAFGFPASFLEDELPVSAALPFFTQPPLEEPLPFLVTSVFEPENGSFLPLAATPSGPAVVALRLGFGRVILSTTSEPFTNQGLKDPAQAAFVLNLLGSAAPNAPVWFDEWHHGKRLTALEPGGPGLWLRATPQGRGVLYGAVLLLVWIVLSGRAFGRPVPVRAGRTRRAALEYVTAIANLNQRAGNRIALLGHFHRRIKHLLGRRYRIDPALPDPDFAAQLRQLGRTEEADAVEPLLLSLSRPAVSEQELVQAAAEAAKYSRTHASN